MDIFDVFTIHQKKLYTVLNVRVEEVSLLIEDIIKIWKLYTKSVEYIDLGFIRDMIEQK